MLGEKKPVDEAAGHLGRYEVCELFSPPRVCKRALECGLRGGWSLDSKCVDLVTGSSWDLSDEKVQSKVWKLLRRDKPLVVGLSPPCTLFSALQNLRKESIPEDEMRQAMGYVRFCVDIAKYQHETGRFFYFEHPLTASSWTMPELDGLRQVDGVESVTVHMCAFGLMSSDEFGPGLVKKPKKS